MWRSDPNDPSTWLSTATLDIKIVCTSQIVYVVVRMHIFACQCISSIFLHVRLVSFTSPEVSEISGMDFSVLASKLVHCLHAVCSNVYILCIAFVASMVQYLYLCVGLSRSCFLS